MKSIRNAAFAAVITGVVPASVALADVGHGDSTGIGSPGTNPTRTINVSLKDNFYEPESISVSKGETVRFVLKNDGEFLHEFNINTPEAHAEHAPMMAMMVEMGVLEPDRINHEVMNASKGSDHDMSHDEPNSVLVEPGKSAEIVWTFDTEANLEFACNIPGHYDSGMAGPVKISH